MRDLFEICGECRHLSDAQVVYRITKKGIERGGTYAGTGR